MVNELVKVYSQQAYDNNSKNSLQSVVTRMNTFCEQKADSMWSNSIVLRNPLKNVVSHNK